MLICESMVAVVVGINSTRNAGNFTQLHLEKLFPALLMLVLLIPNTTANHDIIYTYFTELFIYCR